MSVPRNTLLAYRRLGIAQSKRALCQVLAMNEQHRRRHAGPPVWWVYFGNRGPFSQGCCSCEKQKRCKYREQNWKTNALNVEGTRTACLHETPAISNGFVIMSMNPPIPIARQPHAQSPLAQLFFILSSPAKAIVLQLFRDKDSRFIVTSRTFVCCYDVFFAHSEDQELTNGQARCRGYWISYRLG